MTKITRFCARCGSGNTETTDVNSSDYVVCGDCGFKVNLYEDKTPDEKDD